MKSPLLIVSPQASFGALVQKGLDSKRFEAAFTSDFSEAVRFVQKKNCLTVLLDAELEDVELSVMDIGFALRQVQPDIQFVLVVSAGQEIDTASLTPVATLTKPISLPDLGRLLERITSPASNQGAADSHMHDFNNSRRIVENSTDMLWLTDVSKAAQQLTQLNLESSAQAAFITRSNELWAYAGQLSREAAQELTDSIQRHWDEKGESDLLRFIRLQATGAQHMLYVHRLSDNMTLALVFDAETPFSTIRTQAGKLVKNLFDSARAAAEQAPSAKSPSAELTTVDLPGEEELQDIPPISELLGEVPPPIPAPHPVSLDLPWERGSRTDQPLSEPAPQENSDQISLETSRPIHRQTNKRPIPAMDETIAAKAPEQDPGNLTPSEEIPADLQATRKHEARFDPQSVIETRVQTSRDVSAEVTHRILIEPPSYYQVNLSYACLLIPRFEHHHLVGDAAARLNEWVPQLCVAFGWRLEYISVRPEYLQWIVRVPLATAPGKVINIVRKHTSDRFFNEFPRFRHDNPSGEFWAPGFIVQGGSQPHPQKQVRDFIHQTRIRQGLG